MKKFIGIIVLMTISTFLAACSSRVVPYTQVERVAGEEAKFSSSELVTLAEGEKIRLLLDAKTGMIRVMSIESGSFLDTKMFDTTANAKSDIIATYYTGEPSDLLKTTNTMDNYSYSVEMEGMRYETLENGVRIIYEMGSNKKTYKDFPAYITEERMNALVLDYLDEDQKKIVKKQYRLTKSGIYSRKTNKDNPLSGLAAPQLYTLFYELGKYSYEELEVDNTEHNKLDEMPQKQHIVISVDYFLDGDDLVVRIPVGEMNWNEEYPIRYLDVLPYFLTSMEEDGYLFVPDGSGALIYLDSKKTKEYQYTSRYYGGDYTIENYNYDSSKALMTLPVYGLKTGDLSVLGVIEKGAEIAELSAFIKGYYSDFKGSGASLRFHIRDEQSLVSNYSLNSSTYTMKKVSDDFYREDIQIRYMFQTEDDASYSGMAKDYSKYLMEANQIREKKVEEDTPIYIELLGELDKKKYMLGIPYNGSISLTNFKESKEILASLLEDGLKNIKLIYTGVSNKGINQRAIKEVTLSNKLGGIKEWNSLLSYANENKVKVFPNFKLQTAVSNKRLSKDDLAFYINDNKARLYRYDIVEGRAIQKDKLPTYIINPKALNNYLDSFMNSYEGLGVKNLASMDFMSFLAGDYRKNGHYSLTNGKEDYKKGLEKLSNDYELMLSNPLDLAFPYVDYITDLPMESSKMKIFDASIPFVQLALDGVIPYSTPVLNDYSLDLSTDIMKAIETKSGLKFRFMAASGTLLEDTTMNHIFMAEFPKWRDKVGEYYKQYDEFYQKVADETIVNHEMIDRDTNLRIVTYSNGVTVRLNYSDEDKVIEDVLVPSKQYVVE